MNIVWVVAELRPGYGDPDGAVGVREVSLGQPMEPGIAAGAAHRKVAMNELVDFEISTIDPASREAMFESELYQQGSGGNGSIELVAKELHQIA